MYEKMGDVKRAASKYQRASQLEEIGNLTKDMMFDKYDSMNSLTHEKIKTFSVRIVALNMPNGKGSVTPVRNGTPSPRKLSKTRKSSLEK
jgi:hypothetical protein